LKREFLLKAPLMKEMGAFVYDTKHPDLMLETNALL
jgi:hypothetical protein